MAFEDERDITRNSWFCYQGLNQVVHLGRYEDKILAGK